MLLQLQLEAAAAIAEVEAVAGLQLVSIVRICLVLASCVALCVCVVRVHRHLCALQQQQQQKLCQQQQQREQQRQQLLQQAVWRLDAHQPVIYAMLFSIYVCECVSNCMRELTSYSWPNLCFTFDNKITHTPCVVCTWGTDLGARAYLDNPPSPPHSAGRVTVDSLLFSAFSAID